ncbi:MAG: hypothetical protein R3B96_05160 [Pirellulaceae bacterium]
MLSKLGAGAEVHAIRPSTGWVLDEASGEWRLDLADWVAGEETRLSRRAPLEGLEECGVEARVILNEAPLAADSSDDDDTNVTRDDSAHESDEGDESDAPLVAAEDDSDSTIEFAPLRPAPAPIASAPRDRTSRSLEDEPQVLAPRTRGVEMICDGPTTTQVGASVIYALRISNRSDLSLDQLELSADLPAGVFLEGRRRVLVGETVEPGNDVTLEVAVRAHAEGRHGLKFVLLNDGLPVATVEHELEVLDGVMQVELIGPEAMDAGTEAVFSVEVQYLGDEPIENVVVTLQLDERQRVTTLEHAAGFDPERRLLAWRIVELNPGDEVQLRYKVIGESAGPFAQAVAVSAETLEGAVERRIDGEIRQPAASRGVRRSISGSARPAPEVRTPANQAARVPRTASRPVPPPATTQRPEAPVNPPRTPDPNGRIPLRDPPRTR